MDFFKIRSVPGSVWPPIVHPNASLVWSAYRELDRTQWLSAAELEAGQLRQLRALLQQAALHVPYYRQVLANVGPVESLEDFRRVPFLTRQAYQLAGVGMQATGLPPGFTPTGEGFTSGTNGVPIRGRKTNRDDMWWAAFCMRDFEWCGMDPRKRVAGIRLLSFSPDTLARAMAGSSTPFWAPFAKELFEQGPSFAMDVRQDPRRQLAWLREVSPAYLISMPSNLEILAGLVEESGQPLRSLESIQTIGESMSPEVRQRIERGFGVPVHDLYSTSEGGYMASPCPDGHGYHVHSENVLVEVLDDNDIPCAPGEPGHVVFTSLHNFITPFIRYKVLDDVVPAMGDCPCGRGLPLWKQVIGRRHPTLVLDGDRRKSSIGLTLGLRQVGGVHQFQCIQKAVGHVVLRVVPDRTWTEDTEQMMRDCVWSELKADVQVDIEKHDFLERGAGGKLKIVVVECAP